MVVTSNAVSQGVGELPGSCASVTLHPAKIIAMLKANVGTTVKEARLRNMD
jgi:hypothetical protein